MQVLANAITADGNYPSTDGVYPLKNDNVCLMSGTFAGATVKLQVTLDGTIWIDVPSSSATTNATFRVQLSQEAKVRANVAGAGAASITVALA